MAAPTELVKGNALLLILSCLSKGPMHGYGIVKEIKETSEGYFEMGEGTLYPHLHTMERDGLVEGFWETVTGERRRKLYRITDEGSKALARKQKEWTTFQRRLNGVLGLAAEGV